MKRILLPLAAGLLIVAGCGDERTAEGPVADTATASGQTSGAPSPGASGDAAGRDGFDPIDPATGGLSLNAEGAQHSGEWDFKDVNGSVTEQAGGGETRQILQLEAHNDPVHFKIRLIADDGDIKPGRYRVGDPSRTVDATYENTGVFYKSVGTATGTVTLTSASTDRAVGTYDLTLATLSDSAATVKVSGNFDMRVQR